LTPGILPFAASPPAALFAPLLRRSARAKKSDSLLQGVKALLLRSDMTTKEKALDPGLRRDDEP
jgi:hypothetical protein